MFALISHEQSKVSPAEAHNITLDAYVYFHPLLTMEITRKQFTNIKPDKEFCCRCSTCAVTCSPRQAGVPGVRRPRSFWWNPPPIKQSKCRANRSS
jgi:hypothetical protein